MLGLRERREHEEDDREKEREEGREPAQEFEVVRRLGAGSYAVVYLVREVLDRPPPRVLDGLDRDERGVDADDIDLDSLGHGFWDDDECFDGSFYYNDDDDDDDDGGGGGAFDLDLDGLDGCRRGRRNGNARDGKRVYYGREYAVKVLSKAGMDEEALEAQLAEANIHQSLPAHPNIVTLHRTLETPSFLLLVLEFVPGEDLFYFLEQARDHYEPEPPSANASRHLANRSTTDVSVLSVNTLNTTRTPPTPSLLSTLNEKQLLGKRRLKLIASMFAQMCEAVAVCHDVGVYHRDIKPENFIVTDGWAEDERRVVVVKLTDFGLSTRDAESSDMDCGSAPYMSFECRNNCAPTYAPRAADVWSLGIVLVNMLYHINPWTDTTQGVCPSFSAFLAAPEHFFLQRFAGIAPPVAAFLAHRVFCVLPAHDPADT
ncbi:kinase-like domain-containing protein, partial [Phellopilus nigrolimitatus]